jgi:arsenate reductase (thioredoxin)
MQVLGLQGSPRKKGNTVFMVDAFLQKSAALGAQTHLVEVDQKNIVACKEYIVCEKKGFCPIKDDMHSDIYALIRQADVVLVASPIFFYHITAQLKGLIDRCQLFWARKYKLKLNDPKYKTRRGLFMGVAATRGANLFEGSETTAKYFFDAIGAAYDGSLNFRGIEHANDLQEHATALGEINQTAEKIVSPLLARKKILFVGQKDAGVAKMASTLAQYRFGGQIEVDSAAQQPAAKINPDMAAALTARGIDMAFLRPQALKDALGSRTPEMVITIDNAENPLPDVPFENWEFTAPAVPSEKTFGKTADDIEQCLETFVKKNETNLG